MRTIIHTYTHRFYAECPNNGQIIPYVLTVETIDPVRIMVEHIVTACALHRRGFQEDITAALVARFGCKGEVRVEAHHHGVDIRSVTA